VRDSKTRSRAAKWADSAIIVCLFLFAGFAPHSIAAAQTAWLFGMLLWVARFAFDPPPRVHRTPVDYALLGFFVLTGLSAFLSYEPLVIKELKATGVKVYAIGLIRQLDADTLIRISPRERAETFLTKITKETGGRAVFPKSKKIDVDGLLNELLGQ